MSEADVIALFDQWRQDIDSEPFAYEAAPIAASTPATPVGGCTRTLAALTVLGGGSLYLLVHLIVWAVS